MEILLKLLFLISFVVMLGIIGFVGILFLADEDSSDDIYD